MSLLPQLSKYLDQHLTIRVLQDLQGKGVYTDEEIKATLTSLLGSTKMLKALESIVDSPAEKKAASERLEAECKKIEVLRQSVNPLISLVDSPEKLEDLKKCGSVKMMEEQYGISLKMLEDFYAWVHENYDFGLYNLALSGLTGYSAFATKLSDHPPSFARSLQMRWGVLACNILEKNWSAAAATVVQLDEVMESETKEWSQAEVMRQRTWLLHWALFVLFKTPVDQHSTLSKVYDWFASEKALSAITKECPYLLRYVCVALILNRKLYGSLQKDLVHVLAQEEDVYSDAVTQFVLALHQDLDFELAQTKLQEMLELAKQDYFLFDLVEEIKTNARQNVFSSYCQIHQCVNVSTIAEKMGMEVGNAEDWIQQLIQSGKLNATIRTAETGELLVEFEKSEHDVHSLVEERSSRAAARLFLLASTANQIVKPVKTSSYITEVGCQLARFA